MGAMNRGEAAAFLARLEAKAAAKKGVPRRAETAAQSDAEFLDTAVQAGKFLPPRRPHYEKMMAKNGPATRALIDSMTGYPELGRIPSVELSKPTTGGRFATQMSMGSEVVDLPLPTTPRPTLFADGDLPAVTASGIDPTLLQRVPWQARPALARASRAEAAAMFELYGGPEGEVQASYDAMGGGPLHADVAEYEQRLSRWASGFER
jgi:hypothetical protein